MNPFLSLNNKEKLKKRLLEELGSLNISKDEINEAVEAAWVEKLNFEEDIRKKEKKYYLFEGKKMKGIVLSGRPYHIDQR